MRPCNCWKWDLSNFVWWYTQLSFTCSVVHTSFHYRDQILRSPGRWKGKIAKLCFLGKSVSDQVQICMAVEYTNKLKCKLLFMALILYSILSKMVNMFLDWAKTLTLAFFPDSLCGMFQTLHDDNLYWTYYEHLHPSFGDRNVVKMFKKRSHRKKNTPVKRSYIHCFECNQLSICSSCNCIITINKAPVCI